MKRLLVIAAILLSPLVLAACGTEPSSEAKALVDSTSSCSDLQAYFDGQIHASGRLRDRGDFDQAEQYVADAEYANKKISEIC
jgi:hypothetical protein